MMKKYLHALVLLSAGMTLGIAQAAKIADDDQQLADGSGIDFNCELGNKVTIYQNASDSNRIGLRWNKKVHELTRVATTTGAHRFENKESGLVWIGIPAKGMLLDSKQGRQLANECKSREQMKS